MGTSLDKGFDMGPLVNESQLATVKGYVEKARQEGAEIFQIEAPEGPCYYPPTIITNVNTASTVVMEEIFGPGAFSIK